MPDLGLGVLKVQTHLCQSQPMPGEQQEGCQGALRGSSSHLSPDAMQLLLD
jgi:hypothetical protein